LRSTGKTKYKEEKAKLIEECYEWSARGVSVSRFADLKGIRQMTIYGWNKQESGNELSLVPVSGESASRMQTDRVK
jgi:hypothetical protein